MKKYIALLLLLAMTLSLFAGCGKTEPPAATPETPAETPTETPETPAEPEAPVELVDPGWVEPNYDHIENTLENRQKALCATAAAYYYKGIINQYGLQDLNPIDEFSGGGLRGRTLERNTPEENTLDLTLYQWCSSYMYDIVYNAFGYRINDEYQNCRTSELAAGRVGDKETVIYKYTLTGNEAVDKPKIDAVIADLLPGDIITYIITGVGGHSVMVVDDMTGDGVNNILHRSGDRYNMTTGQDKVEGYGIKRVDMGDLYTGTINLYDKASFSVIRVTELDAEKYPITNSAKARMAWPGLRIDRTVEGGVLGAVTNGDTLTYTLQIHNYGTEEIKGLPVMDKLDSHCTMVSQDGKPATTTYPVWTVDIPATSSVTLTYTVKVEGNPGELIVSEGGSVAGIPSNQLTTTIRAYTPDAEKLQSEAAAAAAAASDGLDFVNKLYEAATGVNPGILPMEEVRNAIFDTQTRANFTLYYVKEDLSSAMGSIHIPTYVGGRNVYTGPNDRVLETRLKDLVPGDIIIVDGVKQGKKTPFYWIYNGEKLVEWNNGKVKNVTDGGLEKLLSYDFFVGLRPSLAK